MIKSIAVFCGSKKGGSDTYTKGAIELGKELASRDITLIYGGASVGLMGTLADTVLQEGGKAIGVIPAFLEDREIAHKNLTELISVSTMHERKHKMNELADGFIAMPGGPGTLEEFFEVFTWSQIGLHQKPCGVLNINHYYDSLLSLFDHMYNEQFLQLEHKEKVLADSSAHNLLEKLSVYTPPAIKTY